MKRWLLLTLLSVAALLLALGVLAVRHSGDAEGEAVPGDSATRGAAQTDLDSRALIARLDASPLSDIAKASLAAKCYLVGIDVIEDGCGCGDLWILRYLCYNPARGWYWQNYRYCTGGHDGGLEHGTTAGEYSFEEGSNCNNTEDNWVDPITVVFHGGDADDVDEHASDHGSWSFHDGGTQKFWTRVLSSGRPVQQFQSPGAPVPHAVRNWAVVGRELRLRPGVGHRPLRPCDAAPRTVGGAAVGVRQLLALRGR